MIYSHNSMFLSMIPPPHKPTLFPYTTLFRSRAWFRKQDVGGNRSAGRAIAERELSRIGVRPEQLGALTAELKAPDTDRSEEHTSELQSPDQLVCRLLLEKKKTINAGSVR